eukprot:SAG31_NODE_10715_length_1107_cov_1.045635_1_plen_146_part_01
MAKSHTCWVVIGILLAQLCLGGLSLLGVDSIRLMFANEPAKTIGQVQLWRLLTAPLVPMGLVSWAAATFVVLRHGSALERLHGSMAFARSLCSKLLLAQVLYCAILLAFNGSKVDKNGNGPRADGCLMASLVCFCGYSSQFQSIEV